MNALERILDTRRPRPGDTCAMCEEPKHAQVTLKVGELTGHDHTGPRSKSRTVNLCAEHAAETWTTLVNHLELLIDEAGT